MTTEPAHLRLAPAAEVAQPGDITERFATAERALAALTTVEDAKDLIDYAAAAAELARRTRLGVGAVNYAVAIGVLAEMRMAGFVDAGMEARQIARQGRPSNAPPGGGLRTLAELGIDDRRLAEARRLAGDYTEAEVREMIDAATGADRVLSRKALLRSDAQRMQQSGSNEWHTPPRYLAAAREVLGAIDLDPASTPAANAAVQAARIYTADDDGLAQGWKGRVWLNPPYGGQAGEFAAKLLAEHATGAVTAAILLVSSHSADTEWFGPLWDHLLCFTYGRIAFISPEGDADAPTHGSVFAYLGGDWAAFADVFGEFGAVVARWRPA